MKINRRQFLLNSTILAGTWIILGIPYKYHTGGIVSSAVFSDATFGAYGPCTAREYYQIGGNRLEGMRDWKLTVNLKFDKP